MTEEYFAQGKIDGNSSWEDIPLNGLTFGTLQDHALQSASYRWITKDLNPVDLDAYVAGYVAGFKECLSDWVKNLHPMENYR